jgi:peptidoglycan/LPS O-acetylase OafA/YrhL
MLALGFSVLPLLWVGWQFFKRRFPRKQVRLAAAFGIAVSVLQGIYVLARLDDVTIISKEVAFSPLSLLAAFLLSACGALLFIRARSWLGRLVALSAVTFPTWAPMIFGLLASAVINIFSISELGTPLYNYSLGLISVGAFVVSIVVSGLALKFIKLRAE